MTSLQYPCGFITDFLHFEHIPELAYSSQLNSRKIISIEIESKGLNLAWVFKKEDRELVFPVGIENEETILSVIQSKFKNFDNEKFITSMTSVDDNTLVLWERD